MTKRELLGLRRERDKLERTLGGIRFMTKVPSAVWIVDTNKEHIAVDEARKLGIPIVAILDTNCDPDVVDYPIPGNDDAIRSVTLLTRVIADAVAEGKMARAGASDEGAEELPEWERELLEQQAAADLAAATQTAEAVEVVEAVETPEAVEAVETPEAVEAVEVPADATPEATPEVVEVVEATQTPETTTTEENN
jgi:small subunit ribosomal protein S2